MNGERRPGIGVLTSGGDAPGMNPAVRAVVRAGLNRGARVFAVFEGYEGMVEGGDRIRPLAWGDVGGILHQGGTIIGTARSERFRTREGRLAAAKNLLDHGLDRLVVIGGDGSLTGADSFRSEWPGLLEELVATSRLDREVAERHPRLAVVGLVGSIDNDMVGTDLTIGADTALHRIVEAVDAIVSTAASHQRTFVVEVMGRHCGYLALMSAMATGADWVFIPESPPEAGAWEDEMCRRVRAGREAGRRKSVVILAEGARDRAGQPITADHVKRVLEERLKLDTRLTILGHVQRGGAPSAFDRYLSTLLGYEAVEEVLAATAESVPQIIGMRDNRLVRSPLVDSVEKNRQLAECLSRGEYEPAIALRGPGFATALRTVRALSQALPREPEPGKKRLRLALVHAGGPAPGMNAAVRAAVRLGIDKGHQVFGVRDGVRGLVEGRFEEMGWMSVDGWARQGGASLGTSRRVPEDREFYPIARHLEDAKIDGLLVIGGWAAYQAAYRLHAQRENFPAFRVPLVCLPASIDNNLPGSELAVGADTALNSICEAVDKIKQSAVASQRCVVVEVMGRRCGFLALMSGLATGAERVYLHEEGVTLRALQEDLSHLIEGFRHGKRLGLVIRSEGANPLYTTAFMSALFEEEGGGLFDVRQAILGHLQQGGDPTPFDRTLATRLAAECVDFLVREAEQKVPQSGFVGVRAGRITITPLKELPDLVDAENQRPLEQWWQTLMPVARVMAQPGPGVADLGGHSTS